MDFWARRKAAVEAEAKADEATAIAARDEAAQSEKTDDDLLAELGLPEPETLGLAGDFKPYLAKGVPQRLKTRALRCLWRSNPVLANVDGLVDYGEDFTDAAGATGSVRTAYQVGKGMRAYVEELARKAEAAEKRPAPAKDSGAEADAAPDGEDAPMASRVAAGKDAEHAADVPALTAGPAATVPAAMPDDGTCQRPRRRMAFTFDDQTA